MPLPHYLWAVRRAACALALLSFAFSLSAAETKRRFKIVADDATEALPRFAEQANRELVFSPAAVRGVKTNAVAGEYFARDALDLLVARTNLVVSDDATSGALAIRQGAPDPAEHRTPPNTPGERLSPNVKADETVKLSPFVLQESADAGYQASSTLAGSRTKTAIKDVAAQISVFTPELMSDLGLTNIDEVYLYSTNVEGALEFTPGGDRGAEWGSVQLNNSNRIRGLGQVSNLRDFFSTGFALETYNTERVTLASGPNAILFGLGSPGGITDVSLKRAGFRDRTALTYRRDNFGGHRFTFDTNYVLRPKTVALRLAALDADSPTSRAPNKDENRRLYGAFTFQPFAKTTLRLHGEWVERNASRAPGILARDFVTPWLDRNRPAFNNSRITAAAAVTNQIAAGNLGAVFARNGGASYIFAAGNTPADLPVVNWANTAVVVGAHTLAPKVQDQGTKWSLVRPDVLDPKVNLYGNAFEVRHRGRILNAYLEQQITDDFAVEAGYMKERFRKRQGGFADGVSLEVQADANQFLPDGVTANPNFGKLYVESNLVGNQTGVGTDQEDRDERRLTASYKLDFTRRVGLARWLGRHHFAAMYNDAELITKRQVVRAVITGTPSFLPAAAKDSMVNTSRLLRLRTYLGNGVDHVSPPFTGGALDFAEPFKLTGPGGEAFEVRMWHNPDGAYEPAGGQVQNVITRVLNGQSYLLKDRLIASYGWSGTQVRRKNTLTEAARTRLPFRQSNGTIANTGLYPLIDATSFVDDWEAFDRGSSVNWGLVGRPLPWLSLHFSKSENFAIGNASVFDPYGKVVPGANGEGQDYGFSVHLANGKVALRVNRFVNSQNNLRPDNIVSGLRTLPFNIEDRILQVAPATPKLGMDRERYANVNYQVSNTSEATGNDVELTVNPTANWRGFVSVGRQRTVTQIDDTWWNWVAERLPTWQKFGRGWDVDTLTANSQETIHQAYDRWAATQRDPLIATNGRFVDNQREWRANGLLTYAVTDGRLRGASLGFGGRWRSAPTVGYGLQKLLGGQEVLDLNRPFKGANQFYADAFFSYSFRKVPLFRLLSGWKLQLNVRNLLNEDGLVVTDVGSSGAPQGYATQEPRQVIATLELKF